MPAQEQGSITAFSVLAGFIVALENGYGHLFDNKDRLVAKHVLNTACQSETNRKLWFLEATVTGLLPYSFQRFFFNKALSMGYDLHKLMRKYLIKIGIENGILKNNVKEVIFLGAGYDIRAFMMSLQYPQVNFFELDYGQTRKIKMKALDTLPSTYTERRTNSIQFIECNLSTDTLQSVLQQKLAKENKKIFILEGVTPYLTKKENTTLLNSLSELLTEEDQIIISFANTTKSSSQLSQEAMNQTNESYQLALLPHEVIPFVGKLGFKVIGKKLSREMFEEVDSSAYDPTKASGDNYYILQKSTNIDLSLEISAVPEIKLNIAQNLEANDQSWCTIV